MTNALPIQEFGSEEIAILNHYADSHLSRIHGMIRYHSIIHHLTVAVEIDPETHQVIIEVSRRLLYLLPFGPFFILASASRVFAYVARVWSSGAEWLNRYGSWEHINQIRGFLVGSAAIISFSP